MDIGVPLLLIAPAVLLLLGAPAVLSEQIACIDDSDCVKLGHKYSCFLYYCHNWVDPSPEHPQCQADWHCEEGHKCYRHWNLREVNHGVCFTNYQVTTCDVNRDCHVGDYCCGMYCCPEHYYRQWQEFSCFSDIQCRSWKTGNYCCNNNLCCDEPTSEIQIGVVDQTGLARGDLGTNASVHSTEVLEHPSDNNNTPEDATEEDALGDNADDDSEDQEKDNEEEDHDDQSAADTHDHQDTGEEHSPPHQEHEAHETQGSGEDHLNEINDHNSHDLHGLHIGELENAHEGDHNDDLKEEQEDTITNEIPDIGISLEKAHGKLIDFIDGTTAGADNAIDNDLLHQSESVDKTVIKNVHIDQGKDIQIELIDNKDEIENNGEEIHDVNTSNQDTSISIDTSDIENTIDDTEQRTINQTGPADWSMHRTEDSESNIQTESGLFEDIAEDYDLNVQEKDATGLITTNANETFDYDLTSDDLAMQEGHDTSEDHSALDSAATSDNEDESAVKTGVAMEVPEYPEPSVYTDQDFEMNKYLEEESSTSEDGSVSVEGRRSGSIYSQGSGNSAVDHLDTAGGSVNHLDTAGGSVDHLDTAGGSVDHLDTAGGSVYQLDTASGSVDPMDTAGGSSEDHLDTAGGSVVDHLDTTGGSAVYHLDTAGGSVVDHLDTTGSSAVSHLDTAGGSVDQLDTDGGSSVDHLNTAGGSVDQLDTAGGGAVDRLDTDGSSAVEQLDIFGGSGSDASDGIPPPLGVEGVGRDGGGSGFNRHRPNSADLSLQVDHRGHGTGDRGHVTGDWSGHVTGDRDYVLVSPKNRGVVSRDYPLTAGGWRVGGPVALILILSLVQQAVLILYI